MHSEAQQERRLKILSIDDELVLALLMAASGIDTIKLPILKNVPDDVEILRVRHCWERRSFEWLVCHPTFDILSPGCVVLTEQTVYEIVEFKRDKEAKDA